MKLKEEDKVFIKRINSNLMRVHEVEQSASKIEFLSKVENDAMVFSIILQKRGDYVHSKEYIKVALNANNHMLSELLGIEREIEEVKKS